MKNQMNQPSARWALGMGISTLCTLACITPNMAWADSPPAQCFREAWIRLESKLLSAKCELTHATEPLKLSITTRIYPYLGNESYSVEYWEGSYTRTSIEKVTYLHEIYNLCTQETRYSERVEKMENLEQVFPIQNPNLSPDITKSYQLLPMSRQDAESALSDAKKACLEE